MTLNGQVVETKKVVKGKELVFKKYIPNDPFEIVELIEDHIGLARKEKELITKKDIIDKGSENAITLRNFFGVSKIAISQFNRDMADMDRRRFTELTPQLEDFKNSGNVSEDADMVWTIFNPDRYNLTEYSGIQRIKDFGGRYRSLSILKSRDGGDMIKHDLNFCGENGVFRELPTPFMQHNYREAKEFTKFN
jgi:replicative DNA helicase